MERRVDGTVRTLRGQSTYSRSHFKAVTVIFFLYKFTSKLEAAEKMKTRR